MDSDGIIKGVADFDYPRDDQATLAPGHVIWRIAIVYECMQEQPLSQCIQMGAGWDGYRNFGFLSLSRSIPS